jgi:hypothetical protein
MPTDHEKQHASKTLPRVAPSWGCKDGDGKSGDNLHDLGGAVLAQAMIGHRGKGHK